MCLLTAQSSRGEAPLVSPLCRSWYRSIDSESRYWCRVFFLFWTIKQCKMVSCCRNNVTYSLLDQSVYLIGMTGGGGYCGLFVGIVSGSEIGCQMNALWITIDGSCPVQFHESNRQREMIEICCQGHDVSRHRHLVRSVGYVSQLSQLSSRWFDSRCDGWMEQASDN